MVLVFLGDCSPDLHDGQKIVDLFVCATIYPPLKVIDCLNFSVDEMRRPVEPTQTTNSFPN